MAARVDVRLELGQFVAHQLQGLLAACQLEVAGPLDLRLDLLVGFLCCLEEMSHVLESALNIVKRLFRLVAHAGLKGAFPASTATKLPRRIKDNLSGQRIDVRYRK